MITTSKACSSIEQMTAQTIVFAEAGWLTAIVKRTKSLYF